MKEIKLNETPVRTSRNFQINNIKLENIEIPQEIKKFDNVEITYEAENIKIDNNVANNKLVYGVGTLLENQVKEKANQKIQINIEEKTEQEIKVDFKIDKENKNLLDNIEIIANKDVQATIIIKYEIQKEVKGFHNGIVRVLAKENSNINIIIVNLINSISNNFMSIENIIESNANVKYTVIDFGGKNSITSYYSNLEGEKSQNSVNTIYLGREQQLFDLNYIGELRGEKSNIDIEVQGALKDEAKKHFKGTIDFKKGCKKAQGNENEFCMLLSDKAKSIALPMLLCSEEDIVGNHATSAGKVGEKELFYIMSRGFSKKDAIKLMVRAKFNKALENVKNEELKEEILMEIDKRLD